MGGWLLGVLRRLSPSARPEFVEGRAGAPYPVPNSQSFIFLALAFAWVCFAALVIQTRQTNLLAAPAVLSVIAIAAEVFLRRVAPSRDPLLWPSAVLLMAFGLIVIARVAPNFLPRQMLWLCLGAAGMCAVAPARFSLRWLRRFKYTWLLIGLALLAATLFFGVNPAGQGAPLWLSLLGVFFQPAEVLRLLMIAFLAAFYAGDGPPLAPLQGSGIKPALLMGGVALALLAVQQDLGAGALLLLTFLFMLYLATGRGWFSLMGFAALVAVIALGGLVSARVNLRIQTWLNPFGDPLERSFQIAQSLIAVASGGVFGQGVGQGFPAFVPAVHTDFPFVAIAEEFGLVGALTVIALFAVIVLRAWRVAQNAPDAYGFLLAGGIAASFAVQVFVIIGGNLALVPLTGVTLPFVSYGGSSLAVSCLALGLVIHLSGQMSSKSHGAARMVSSSQGLLRQPARVSAGLSAAMLAACALAVTYWGVVQSQTLTARDDNPRRVLAEQAIQRGRILARDGQVLAVSSAISQTRDPLVSRLAVFARQYPQPQAAPFVGYYSLNHGLSGVEESADVTLRGARSFGDALLHRPQAGADVTTTLDLRWQNELAGQLAGATGGAVALNARTGEVLALVSAPFYNPNTLDKEWDALKQNPSAPLLNRAVDGAYPVSGLGLGAALGQAQTASPVQVARALAGLPAALPIHKTLVRPSGGSVVWQAELRGDVVVVTATER